MTFAAPLWLLLLLAVPVLIWLHRRSRQPIEIRVASVEAFRGAEAAEAETRTARRVDPLFALLLLAVISGALAAAGPSRSGATGPAAIVIVDVSASMGRTTASGSTLADLGLEELGRTVTGAIGQDAQLDLRLLAQEYGAVRASEFAAGDFLAAAAEDAMRPRLTTGVDPWSAADGLPDSIAPYLRSDDGRPVVLVTDRVLDAGAGVIVLRPSEAPLPFAAATSVIQLADGSIRLGVGRMGGASAARVEVVHSGQTVSLLHAGEHIADLPPRVANGTLTVRVVGAKEGRTLRVSAARGARVVAVAGSATFVARVTAVLDAIGLRLAGSEDEADIAIVEGDTVVAVPPATIRFGAPRDTGRLAPSDVFGQGPLSRLAVGAGAELFVVGERPHGSAHAALLVTGSGARAVPLATRPADHEVACALAPGVPESTWHADPSFVAFLAAAVQALAPDRLTVEGGLVPVEEFVEAAPPTEQEVETAHARLRDALTAERDAPTENPLELPLAIVLAGSLAGALVLSLRPRRV